MTFESALDCFSSDVTGRCCPTMNWVKSDSPSNKRKNRRMLIDVIRSQMTTSRVEISRLTHLSKVAVSALIDSLVQDGVVEETGSGDSSVGRKPILLSLSDRSGFILGIELNHDYGRIICLSLNNKIVHLKHFQFTTTERQLLLDKILTEVRAFIVELPTSRYGVLGIGMAIRGVVNKDQSTVIKFAETQVLDHFNLGQFLSTEFGLPVIIDNRSNAAAWGEHLLGVARNSRSSVFIMPVRIGVGCGLVLDNHLYRGVNGFAGEISHMPVDSSGPACAKGHRGCLSVFISELGIRRICKELGLNTGPGDVLGDSEQVPWLIQQAELGDLRAQSVFRSIGKSLGVGLASLVTVMAPDTIVIGGRLAPAIGWLRPKILETLESHCSEMLLESIKIVVPENALSTVVRGAAALAIDLCLERLAFGSL